jgi:hypothetical protein
MFLSTTENKGTLMPDHTAGFCALLLGAVLLAPTAPAIAACETKSGNSTVALLELYTSEGCSSCPPADKFVSELPRSGFKSDRVVPLAFHVDYWNYLGWTDPFSQSDFTRRQRDFARRTNAVTVYTPELVLSGAEYRRWWGNSFERAIQQVNRAPPRADIGLKLNRNGGTLQIDGNASVRDKSNDARSASFYVALYQNNLSNKIASGENSGRTLDHSFVVRRLYGPFAFDSTGAARFNQKLTLDAGWKPTDLGVAAFVQESRGTAILQALALDVCS